MSDEKEPIPSKITFDGKITIEYGTSETPKQNAAENVAKTSNTLGKDLMLLGKTIYKTVKNEIEAAKKKDPDDEPSQEEQEAVIRDAMWRNIRLGIPINPQTDLDRKIYQEVLAEQRQMK